MPKPKTAKISSNMKQRLSTLGKKHSLPVVESDKPYWIIDWGLSVSGLSLWLQCREQFRLKYIQGWRKVDKNEQPLVFGSLFHQLIEDRPNPKDDEAIIKCMSKVFGLSGKKDKIARSVLEAKASAAYKVYYKRYKLGAVKEKKVNTEKKFNYTYKFEHKGQSYSIQMQGYIDAVLDTGRSIMIRETKTRSDMAVENTTLALAADLQTNSYFLACEQVLNKFPDALEYDLVKKPAHEWNSTKQTLAEFHERVLEAIEDEPTKFFHRIPHQISLTAFNRWRQTVLHHHLVEFIEWYRRVEAAGWQQIEPYNPVALIGRYGPCELFGLIISGNTVGLFKKESKHDEETLV